MPADTLPATDLARFVVQYADALGVFQEEINGLNVYPVPDGDTGTNLRLTMEAVRKELDSAVPSDGGGVDVPRSIARASLMGARGNSGVITSQIFRGLSEAVGEAGEVSQSSLTSGLRRGTDYAYKAVTQPQEGTILTVVREAAEEAEGPGGADEDLVAFVRRVLERARASLERTPDQLPVLKQAGVVDAGGRGLVLFLECVLHALDGTPLPEPKVPQRAPADAVTGAEEAAVPPEGGLEFKFEVQFLLDTDDEDADRYRTHIERYGDCVLVVGGQGLYNVHIHTNDVGAVIEDAIAIGRPRQIDVQYLEGQAQEFHEATVLAQMRGEDPPAPEPTERLGVVAVGSGEGILSIFRSLGVKGLVPGGQTFNPSAEEILDGIRVARAEEVVIFPNNKNVIGTAQTAAQVAVEEGIVRRAEVLPTESPLQGFTALVALDPDGSLDENLEAMSAEGLGTKHGEIAVAVRDADTPVGHVEQGQVLGLAQGKVATISPDPQQGVIDVLEVLVADGDSLVTLVYGADIDEWSAHELGKRLAERFDVEVEVHRGGQPHYPFLIGVE